MRSETPWRPLAGLLVAALTAVSACGADDGASDPPAPGSIEATASTTGSTLDADGYTVTVDGGAGQPIGINGSTTFAGWRLAIGRWNWQAWRRTASWRAPIRGP